MANLPKNEKLTKVTLGKIPSRGRVEKIFPRGKSGGQSSAPRAQDGNVELGSSVTCISHYILVKRPHVRLGMEDQLHQLWSRIHSRH